ncbi:MAG: hypothetical protein V4527_18250 [Pseudomonadota bacterium]
MARKIDWKKQILRSRALEQWRRVREAMKAGKRAAPAADDQADRA